VSSVALIGLMGCGKSTVGKLVADHVGYDFVDVDIAIRVRTGKTVRELWETGGEVAYRRLESLAVLEALSASRSVVLATPGGAVLDPAVRAALKEAFVVWLRADPLVLSSRVGHDDHRPLLNEDPFGVLQQMADQRSAIYGALADIVIDADHHDATTIAQLIVQTVEHQSTTT
jgi:shikimate kinase